MNEFDRNSCVSFEEIASLKARAKQLETPGDEASLKAVSETISKIVHSDELLKAAGESFLMVARILRNAVSLPVGSPMHFIRELLPPEMERTTGTDPKALKEFADEIEEVRLRQGGRPRQALDVSTLELADLNRIIEMRDALIAEYRLLIAEMYRQCTTEGEFVRRLELGRRSILVDIVNRAVDATSPSPKPSVLSPETPEMAVSKSTESAVPSPATPKKAASQFSKSAVPSPEKTLEKAASQSSKSSVPSPKSSETAVSPHMESSVPSSNAPLSPDASVPPSIEETPQDEQDGPIIPCVSNPMALRSAGDLRLTWDWPDGATEVAILWRHDATPESPRDKLATRKVISKIKYNKTDAFVIPSCGNESYRLALFTLVHNGDATFYSAGVECVSIGMAEKTTISYRFRKKRKWILFGPVEGVKVVIKSPGIFPLPDLTIMKKRSGLPLGRSDGTLVCTISGVCKRRMAYSLPLTRNDSGFYLKMFADDVAREDYIAFNHPPFSKLRI